MLVDRTWLDSYAGFQRKRERVCDSGAYKVQRCYNSYRRKLRKCACVIDAGGSLYFFGYRVEDIVGVVEDVVDEESASGCFLRQERSTWTENV
jgi:hypothetical protein